MAERLGSAGRFVDGYRPAGKPGPGISLANGYRQDGSNISYFHARSVRLNIDPVTSEKRSRKIPIGLKDDRGKKWHEQRRRGLCGGDPDEMIFKVAMQENIVNNASSIEISAVPNVELTWKDRRRIRQSAAKANSETHGGEKQRSPGSRHVAPSGFSDKFM